VIGGQPAASRRAVCIGGCWPFFTATAARSRRTAPSGGGCGGWYGWDLFGFLVRAKVMTAHTLPPAAIHRHAAVSWGPRTKTKALRVHTVIAELAMTTHDSSRIRILTRHAPARPDNGAGSQACSSGPPRSRPDLARRNEMATLGCDLA
jgi:hypothetical protein